MATLDPLSGPASLVLPKVIKLAASIINHPDIDSFKIGRTNHPMGHRNAYECVELFTIYKTFDAFDSQKVEQALLEQFKNNTKWSDATDPELAISSEMAQFVFLAVW